MRILRRRYIPDEVVDISNDLIVFLDENLIVTKWEPIKKRDDIGRGVSFTFLKEGYKISKIFDKDDNFRFYYCDIINTEVIEGGYQFNDLLVDLKIYPDDTIEVLDIEELDEALEKGLITEAIKQEALEKLEKLKNVYITKGLPKIIEKYN